MKLQIPSNWLFFAKSLYRTQVLNTIVDNWTLTSQLFDADGNSTYTVTGDFGTGGWKFRAGQDWPLNLGGDLTFLNVDGDNIVLSAAGTYTATLSFNGETFSATIQ